MNDDGTFPLKRRIQVVLRVVEGKQVLLETCKDVKPVWKLSIQQQTDSSDMSSENVQEARDEVSASLTQGIVDGLVNGAPDLVREFVRLLRKENHG